MSVNGRVPQPRRSGSLVLPVVIGLLGAGAVVVLLHVFGVGQAAPGAPGSGAAGETGSAGVRPSAGGRQVGAIDGGLKSANPAPATDAKPKAGPVELDEYLKLVSGDVQDQYKGYGGLARMSKEGLRPGLVKQIVEHATKLIESGEKEKVVTGIKLLEVSGEFRQGELVLTTWAANPDDKNVAGAAEASLFNLVRLREYARLKKVRPEWDEKKLLDQAMGHALSKSSGRGSDPAKWRELWKTLMAGGEPESGSSPEAEPEAPPAPKSGDAPAPAPGPEGG